MLQFCVQNFYYEIAKLILSILIIYQVLVSGQSCVINKWCRPSQTDIELSNFSTEYNFLNFERKITWFEALEVCRNENRGSELLYIDSSAELNWVIQMAARYSNSIEEAINDSLWLVNAHMYLYNSNSSAWANGLPLDDRYIHRRAERKFCKMWIVIPYAIENECFGLVSSNVSASLVDLNCTVAYTYRAICKRYVTSRDSTSKRKAEGSLIAFNRSEWTPFRNNQPSFYRILDLESEIPGRILRNNWYSARLLCMKYGAVLSDIESMSEYLFLERLIESSYRKDGMKKSVYFIDLHRYLYSITNWSWGGLPNSNRSYMIPIENNLPPDNCEPQICGGIYYFSTATNATNPGNIYYGVEKRYCSGKWRSRAVCKLRDLNPNAIVKDLIEIDKTFLPLFVPLTLSALSLLLLVLIALCVARYLLSRALVRQPKQSNALQSTSKVAYEATTRLEASATSYGQLIQQGEINRDIAERNTQSANERGLPEEMINLQPQNRDSQETSEHRAQIQIHAEVRASELCVYPKPYSRE